jgi:hypothetical protein
MQNDRLTDKIAGHITRRLAPLHRAWRLVGAAVLALALTAVPLLPAQAAPARQDEPTPILLGQFASADLAASQAVAYSLEMPIDGSYSLVYTGDGDPANFTVDLTDVDGNSAFSGTLEGDPVVDLTAGAYMVAVTAADAGQWAFVIAVEGGTMTDAYDKPGELANGFSYAEDTIGGTRYATLTIADSPYLQRAIVLVEGAEGDVYSTSVYNDEGDYFYGSSDDEGPLMFATDGGVYNLEISPSEGGDALRVTIFLSGPAPTLVMGEETAGELTGPDDKNTYQFEVANPGTVITVEAVSDNDNDVNVTVGRNPDVDIWYGSAYGGDPLAMEFVAPVAGTYYLNISTSNTDGDSYAVIASEGEAAASLAVDEPVSATLPEGGTANYVLEIADSGQFVIVVLGSDSEDDIDLTLTAFDAEGNQVAYDSSTTSLGNEVVAVYSADPSTFIVTVGGAYSGDVDYVLLATTGDRSELLGMAGGAPAADAGAAAEAASTPAADIGDGATLEQWAAEAEASSQYGDDGWSAAQATGEPNTPEAGDVVTAWAAGSPDTGDETLDILFDQEVVPTGLEIYETYNPGAVALIEAFDPEASTWVVLWEGESDTIGAEIAVFAPELAPVEFATNRIRLTIDEPLVPGWNEIDAVKLIGAPLQ